MPDHPGTPRWCGPGTPSTPGEGDLIVPIGIAALALVLYTLFAPGIRSRRNGNGEPEPEPAQEEPYRPRHHVRGPTH